MIPDQKYKTVRSKYDEWSGLGLGLFVPSRGDSTRQGSIVRAPRSPTTNTLSIFWPNPFVSLSSTSTFLRWINLFPSPFIWRCCRRCPWWWCISLILPSPPPRQESASCISWPVLSESNKLKNLRKLLFVVDKKNYTPGKRFALLRALIRNYVASHQWEYGWHELDWACLNCGHMTCTHSNG